MSGAGKPVTVVKYADWVLVEERGQGAPDAIHGAECMTCAARSPLVDNDDSTVAAWAIQHTQDEPEHDLFLLRAEKHWRVLPRHEGGGLLNRTAGPGFVGLMCLCTLLSGYLMALN